MYIYMNLAFVGTRHRYAIKMCIFYAYGASVSKNTVRMESGSLMATMWRYIRGYRYKHVAKTRVET